MIIPILSALLAISYAHAQDVGCDFEQNVVAGQTYYVYSPNYPNSYPRGKTCRWMAYCPVGYQCRLDCDLKMPTTAGCTGDRVLISKTGDPQFVSAERYCGTGKLTAVSVGQRIGLALQTTYDTTGGNFYCELRAQRVSDTPSTCRCGIRKTTRIVGGQDAMPNEFPMMVALVEQGADSIMCGAVIISDTYVVSAAHCVARKSYRAIAVIVGEHDTSTGSDSAYTKAYRVSSIQIHPQYSEYNYDYDAAILQTAQSMTFSEFVGPVCLPFKFSQYDFTGAKLTILGWGTLFIGGPTPNILQKVVVDVISQNTCRQRVSTLTPRQLCTYTPGKDACQMDSGGPLLYTDQNALLYHVGIVSSGSLCASADSPGVNTRMTEMLDWIVRVAPADYCVK